LTRRSLTAGATYTLRTFGSDPLLNLGDFTLSGTALSATPCNCPAPGAAIRARARFRRPGLVWTNPVSGSWAVAGSWTNGDSGRAGQAGRSFGGGCSHNRPR